MKFGKELILLLVLAIIALFVVFSSVPVVFPTNPVDLLILALLLAVFILFALRNKFGKKITGIALIPTGLFLLLIGLSIVSPMSAFNDLGNLLILIGAIVVIAGGWLLAQAFKKPKTAT